MFFYAERLKNGNGGDGIMTEKANAMTEKQIEEFYDSCPTGYEVEETRVFDIASLQYITVEMRYIELF